MSLCKHSRINQSAAEEIVNIHPCQRDDEPIDEERIHEWHHVPTMWGVSVAPNGPLICFN